MITNFKMLAKTLFGFEPLLANELRALGASNIKEGVRNVSFEGDSGFMYKANLCLRTAIKILKPIATFYVRDEKDLYQKVYGIDWFDYLTVDTTFAIDAIVNSETFTHSLYISQKVKDAIVDKFRDAEGKRPNVATQNPDLGINVHIHQNQCTISLDSSGSSLHHRGYRIATNIAPINEVLAAGILLHSGWDGKSDFLDPMCGSGTFLIEAAMIACNIPVNINREAFAFQKWKDYDDELFGRIRQASLNKSREFYHKILGYDKAPSAIRKAGENIANAGLSDYISLEQQDFFKSQKFADAPLHLVTNPPYGERLNVDMETFYGNIGDTLKKSYPGTNAWFITANLEALKFVGLRTSKRLKLFNGSLESKLVSYDIYEGSKRAKFNTSE